MAADTAAHRDPYIMSRDTVASGRLTAQHYLILRRLGWLLHPDIAARIRGLRGLEIADVACGNAIWSLEMAVNYPHARITGIDISPQQFPPQFTLPQNVALEIHDIFQPMPDRYVGRFDVVHVRLIMAAVYFQDKDWVMHNIVRLLKPGGFIQWIDATVPVLRAMNDPLRYPGAFLEPPAITAPLTSLFSHTEWLRHLVAELQRHGLVNLRHVDVPPVPWLSRQDTDNAIWALTDIHEGLRVRAPKEVSDLFGRAVGQTLQDIREGRVYYTTYYTTIGQKPG
ncbi:hypothetical protein Z517_02164 [Fonsecaea pedrosoi CBS 271.37]|uniref:Methyltransferase domain-containing protein n=1 Tax=Fonsecaea pedrosoi CBS 271.37 TaxID=1442368 RepID=A0A0D2DYS8_9EURO|nr:uncharacterized protein Z517_02164 [Fonsecaea pedrosoi CBS 271.37]KIW82921.1 hypothetical protein Z517_02164 [Fonsecaea pedrosoi CBS 271.37]